MSGIEKFLRLLEGRKQAAPVPMSNIQRPYQLPGGAVPPMALSGLQKAQAEQLARGTGGARPRVLPMLANVAQGKYISPLQKALMKQEAEQPIVDTSAALQGAGAPAQTTFGQRYAQPTTQALLGAAIEGADASGYSPIPVSTGQVLARMGAGAMKAYGGALEAQERARKAKIDEEYTRAKTQAELAKTGQAFSGTGMTAQSANTVLGLADKISNGTATKNEERIYGLAYSNLSRPRTEQRTASDGTVTTVQVPGMDLTNFPAPAGFASGERVIGTKDPQFNSDQNLAAGFATRMVKSIENFEKLTSQGYDPSNLQDFGASTLPLGIRGFALTPEGQQYLAAKSNFITAVLRKESGAALLPSEFETEDLKYFPQPGDTEATIEQKRIARNTALESMKAASGGAFNYMQKKMAPADVDSLPKNSVFIKREGGVSFYRTPEGKVLAVD